MVTRTLDTPSIFSSAEVTPTWASLTFINIQLGRRSNQRPIRLVSTKQVPIYEAFDQDGRPPSKSIDQGAHTLDKEAEKSHHIPPDVRG